MLLPNYFVFYIDEFALKLNLILFGLAGLFVWRVNKTLILFGWL